jgi:hypothetical protein
MVGSRLSSGLKILTVLVAGLVAGACVGGSSAISSPGGSTGISTGDDSKIPPAPPAKVFASVTRGTVALRWRGTGSDIVVRYLVTRRPAGKRTIAVASRGDNRGWYAFTARPLPGTYRYRVAAVDRYGNRSTATSSAPVVVRR